MRINYYFGILAEFVTASLYILTFHRFVAWRMRNYLGEIDLIFTRGNTLVFVEVKARRHNLSEVITSQQTQRISRAAEFYCSKHPKYSNYDKRFDLVNISLDKFPEIIKNAW